MKYSYLETCRFCKKSNYEDSRPMVKYSVRHNAHWDCMLRRLSLEMQMELLATFPVWKLDQAPFMLLDELGLLPYVEGLRKNKSHA